MCFGSGNLSLSVIYQRSKEPPVLLGNKVTLVVIDKILIAHLLIRDRGEWLAIVINVETEYQC